MKRRVECAGWGLEYEYTPKRVKNINLRVRSDGTVAVSAPRGVPLAQVEAFLLSRRGWIEAARQRRTAGAAAPFGWQAGQCFDLLGQPVALALCAGPAGARYSGGTLTLCLPDPADTARAAALGEGWYDARCREELARADEAVWRRFAPLGAARPAVGLRWMTSRWGSCFARRGTITLNRRLFAFPPRVAEYVLLHEYCHLLHPDHQAGFYALLRGMAPDWRQCDQLLKGGARFLR